MKPPALADVQERDWQQQVIELARLLGYRVAHFRPARTAHGWATPVQADGAGYPDLHLVRERSLFVELKREKGRPSAEQREWLEALHTAGVEAYVARPSDLETLAAVLKHRGSPLTVPGCEKAYETLRQRTQEALEHPKPRLLSRPATPAADQLAIPPEHLEDFDAFMRRTAAEGGQAR